MKVSLLQCCLNSIIKTVLNAVKQTGIFHNICSRRYHKMPTTRTINFQEKGNSSDVEIDIITETATEDTGSKNGNSQKKEIHTNKT